MLGSEVQKFLGPPATSGLCPEIMLATVTTVIGRSGLFGEGARAPGSRTDTWIPCTDPAGGRRTDTWIPSLPMELTIPSTTNTRIQLVECSETIQVQVRGNQ